MYKAVSTKNREKSQALTTYGSIIKTAAGMI